MEMEILAAIFAPKMLFLITAGCLVGIILGAIPGMNGGIGISLLLPFTFTMRPEEALLMLGGVYMGSTYGGSISAILLNVPGTAESFCTALEGNPLARKRQGKLALYLAALSSVFGGLVGVICLIWFAPMLARAALRFGPPEIFLVGLVGLSVVGSLTGRNIWKGLFSVAFGLFLGMIGPDTVTGDNRLLYGSGSLVMGIELISLILGFFALSEMLSQMMAIYRKRSSLIADGDNKIESLGEETVFGTMRIMLQSKWLLLKSSVMGMFIGVLPGPGGAISAFVAYGEAKRTYKREEFGVGNPRGIIAAESANNGAVGGSLVPMLALGIPGSPTAAIMYGALIIHGLVAGPRLFTDNAPFAYTFIYGMLMTIVIMGLVGVVCVPMFSKILKIDMRYIIPVVMMCSLIGAFSMRNSMFDVYATVVFGVIGCLFARFGIPSSPVVLGLILGKLVETNFRLSVTLASARDQHVIQYIMSRPLSILIVLIGLFLVYANFKTMLLESKATKA